MIESNNQLPDDVKQFSTLIHEFRYDFVKLAYLIFGFGVKGAECENMEPFDWQIRELNNISKHLQNPATRHKTYRLIISTGNGSGKTAFLSMLSIILMYSQKLRGRVTANTAPQLASIVWPEIDVWFRRARFNEYFFEKLGTSIKAKDEKFAEQWRIDQFNWDVHNPARVSGLHNKGGAILYAFEEAAGIPAVIWEYASGAFTDDDAIKIWVAMANSDDPESKFEQNMNSPLWRAVRIDTRTLPHIDKDQIEAWLKEYGGEDSDEFRVRVRGLPRKTSRDSIINLEAVIGAIERGKTFDPSQMSRFPSILTCDPAWTGGDETTIWHHQGSYSVLLERYKLDRSQNEDHSYTYQKLTEWEQKLRVDKVLIDQGEGTAIKTLANMNGKFHWELVSFAGSPNDAPTFIDSQYQNIRAQMYYEANKALVEGHVIKSRVKDWLEDIEKQLCWTKGGRNDKTLKKQAEAKKDIKERVGASPDLADGFVLQFARKVMDRLPDNYDDSIMGEMPVAGSRAWVLPESVPNYNMEYDGYSS